MLTLDLLDGPTLHAWADGEHPQDTRDALAVLLVKAVFGPVVTAHRVNADAHPGNFVVLAEGRLGLLDFGAVVELPPERVRGMLALARSFRAQASATQILEELPEAGFVLALARPRALRMAGALAEAVGTSLRGVHDFAADPPMARFTRLKMDYPLESAGIRPSPEILPVLRAEMGLLHALRRLGARIDAGAELLSLGAGPAASVL